jgi:DNA-binding IclR family transcriptional regulator
MTDETPSSTGARQQKVQAAEVGFGVLLALADLAPSTSLSKLADHLGMPASKVHRYLQALIASGFAEQDAMTHHYGLGRAALQVGLAALGTLDVLKVSAPFLASLRDELDQTCFLAVWGNKGPTVVYVEPSRGAVTLVTQVGSVLPLLTSSTGLVFESFLGDAETASLRAAESTLLDDAQRDNAARHVRQLRERGVHEIQGMLMPGINAASAPLFATGSRLAGVVTVVGSGSVLTEQVQAGAARRLQETAALISRRMGGSLPAQLSTEA